MRLGLLWQIIRSEMLPHIVENVLIHTGNILLVTTDREWKFRYDIRDETSLSFSTGGHYTAFHGLFGTFALRFSLNIRSTLNINYIEILCEIRHFSRKNQSYQKHSNSPKPGDWQQCWCVRPINHCAGTRALNVCPLPSFKLFNGPVQNTLTLFVFKFALKHHKKSAI